MRFLRRRNCAGVVTCNAPTRASANCRTIAGKRRSRIAVSCSRRPLSKGSSIGFAISRSGFNSPDRAAALPSVMAPVKAAKWCIALELLLVRRGSISAPRVEQHRSNVHLAAVLRTPDPEQIWAVNRDGTRNLIAAVKEYAKDARFIMASTGLVYDMDRTQPGREDDVVAPTLPYPASKVTVESAIRHSGLHWSILRFGFVYGDNDGHLEAVPALAAMFKWHPAVKLSILHHADIMTFVKLVLVGAADGRIVNLVDEAPMSIYELAALVGSPVASSAEPLPNPWWGQIDGSFARSLGFRPQIATMHQAIRDGMV